MTRSTSDILTTSENYDERLATFSGYWDDHEATARQLAAIGHVYDRPPLEALEQGSRCISCSAFVKRESSIAILEGHFGQHVRSTAGSYETSDWGFHQASCIRKQVRIPDEFTIECQRYSAERSERMRHPRSCVKGRTDVASASLSIDNTTHRQRASLFSLPTELRLYIYEMVLPRIPRVVSVVLDGARLFRIKSRVDAQDTSPVPQSRLSVLCSCRAIHREALSILFNQRVFCFEASTETRPKATSTKLMYLFLRCVGASGRNLLRNVDIQTGNREDALAFSLLASCLALKSITIRHPHPNIMRPRAPIWYVDGVASLLSLRGLENVDFAECHNSHWLPADSTDAVLITRELTKTRSERGSVRWLSGRWMDL